MPERTVRVVAATFRLRNFKGFLIIHKVVVNAGRTFAYSYGT
jgi:hypothetical protein